MPNLPSATKNIISQVEIPHENDLLEKLLGMDSPPLPTPKQPSKCPLFCCFYAEFDIKVGPVIKFQSPKDFMNNDISISTEKIHGILSKTFENCSVAENSTTAEAATAKLETADLSSKEPTKNEKAGGKSNLLSEAGGLSIFDSTSEYIITGSELTGKIISLSTHDIHIISRPTLISDARYERNALLFSVGMVLRRAADPRPFRTIVTKLALTLRSMEIESQFLSKPSLRKQVQPLLERILLSLNNPQWECNLLLSPSNALNLKLFHPPKPETSPVHDYEVPILLRRDLQLQMYDWDLAINWVIQHIDGVTNARQISIKAEVDLEMVRACLRVLKHHGVIALVDMFMFSNRYEFTDKAQRMLAGQEQKLLQEALEFVVKRPSLSFPGALGNGGSGSDSSHPIHPVGSPYQPQHTPASSYPPRTMNLLGGSQKSSNFRYTTMAAQSLEKESSFLPRRDEQPHLKSALAELYCACNRNISFGDLWISLTTELPTSLVLPNFQKMQGAKSSETNNNQRFVSNRKSSIGDETEGDQFRDQLDCLGLSPLETIHLDTLRKPSSGESALDWNDFFKRFDHRRFFTFGVVHGLLVRVHNYPYFSGNFPDMRTSSSATLTRHNDTKQSLKNEFIEEKSFVLARKIVSFMDGTKCDDELVCYFEKPFNKLVELVEQFGGKKIVSVFAPAPDL